MISQYYIWCFGHFNFTFTSSKQSYPQMTPHPPFPFFTGFPHFSSNFSLSCGQNNGVYHEKADVCGIPKMWQFLSFEDFIPELLAVEVRSKNDNLYFFFNSHPTLTANNSGLKPSKLKTTTFSESRGRQLSHGTPRLGHTIGKH